MSISAQADIRKLQEQVALLNTAVASLLAEVQEMKEKRGPGRPKADK